MTGGFSVDAQQLRAHAAKTEAIQDRFATVRAASSAIGDGSAAYGMLCAWMAGVLDRRHTRQDELIAYVEENLRLAAQAVTAAGADYDRADQSSADRVRKAMP